MNEWSTVIWFTVSSSVTALVLTFAIMLGSSVREMSRVQQAEIDAVEMVKEYREHNKYDGTEVYPQDIISLLLEKRGKPEVWVDTVSGSGVTFTYKWNSTLPDENWTPTYFTGLLPLTAKYEAGFVKDDNGAIIRYEFRRK